MDKHLIEKIVSVFIKSEALKFYQFSGVNYKGETKAKNAANK